MKLLLATGPSGAFGLFSVSNEDAARARAHRWYFARGNRSVYAKARIAGRWVMLHRWLISAPAGLEVDHIDRDQYNCQRDNLRLATRHEQERNKGAMRRSSTGLRGVVPLPGGRFLAKVMVHGRTFREGPFREAWHARLAAMIRQAEVLAELARTA